MKVVCQSWPHRTDGSAYQRCGGGLTIPWHSVFHAAPAVSPDGPRLQDQHEPRAQFHCVLPPWQCAPDSPIRPATAGRPSRFKAGGPYGLGNRHAAASLWCSLALSSSRFFFIITWPRNYITRLKSGMSLSLACGGSSRVILGSG